MPSHCVALISVIVSVFLFLDDNSFATSLWLFLMAFMSCYVQIGYHYYVDLALVLLRKKIPVEMLTMRLIKGFGEGGNFYTCNFFFLLLLTFISLYLKKWCTGMHLLSRGMEAVKYLYCTCIILEIIVSTFLENSFMEKFFLKQF